MPNFMLNQIKDYQIKKEDLDEEDSKSDSEESSLNSEETENGEDSNQ